MSAGRVSPFTLPETPVADRPDRRKKRRSRRVSRILSAVAGRALRRYRFRRDDHSSRPGIARGLQRPTRRLRTGRPLDPPTCVDEPVPPYLVLLRAGFCLPPTLPPARCALTAPFHPYPSTRRLLAEASRSGRYIFCATVRQVTLPGRYPAHCPSEFGLSSRHSAVRRAGGRSSSQLRHCYCRMRFEVPAA